MNPDIPLPSIESESTNNDSLNLAAYVPLPASSPLNTPRASSLLHNDARSTPSRKATTVRSPLNPQRRSSTPRLQIQRSTSSLHNSADISPARQPLLRRASSNMLRSSSNVSNKSAEEKRSEPTAAVVAQEYFRRELALHAKPHLRSKTVIIVHDSCYGHRFSRPRTSKSALSSIVERPERIHASILGLATAYVRMGGRHSEGRYAPNPQPDLDAVKFWPFKIRKTSRAVPLNSTVVTQVHGKRWMDELQIMCDSAEGKLTLNGKELVRPIGYGKDENGNPLPKLHEGDLYLCSESLDAFQGCIGGVCDGVDEIFGTGDTRRAFVCIRPPGHHCSSNFPSGFCWLNNVHVGIAHAASNHGLTHAAIIDFDLHHGDGSQAITWEHNRTALNSAKNAPLYKKTSIGYFSLHDINSYPCEMGDEEKVKNASLCIENAHGQYIWNVHLEPWKDPADFWKLYETKYTVLLEKTRNFLRHHTARINSLAGDSRAKAAIFLSAGFDASEWECADMQRHKLNVPTAFYDRFTADVVKLAEEDGLGVDGRVLSVLEGGYSDRALASGVLSHICGLAYDESTPALNGAAQVNGHAHPPKTGSRGVDADWWTPTNLATLEALVNPTLTDLPSQKAKEKVSGNYSSPTQASTAKIRDQARERRSLSAQMSLDSRLGLDTEPVAPPPEVDWTVASYELSRLIIPSADRQTLSFRHDELNAEATRARRERQSIGVPTVEDAVDRMQLRDRSSRRKTLAVTGNLPDSEEAGMERMTGARQRRRSSTASSMISGFKSMGLDDFDGPKENGSSGKAVAAGMPDKAPKAIAVKKTRAPTASKSQPVKNKVGPKEATGSRLDAPPVPRVPSTFLKKSATQVNTVTNDIDSLVSGVQKIKLQVPSPEENAIREKKKALEKKPRAARKLAVPKAAKAAANTSGVPRPYDGGADVSDVPASASPSLEANSDIPHAEAPKQDSFSASTSLQEDTRVPHAEAPTQDNIPAPTSLPASHQGPHTGAPMPETISAPALVDLSHQRPPPPPAITNSTNTSGKGQLTSTAQPTTTKTTNPALPTFTSTSQIPFATANTTLGPSQQPSYGPEACAGMPSNAVADDQPSLEAYLQAYMASTSMNPNRHNQKQEEVTIQQGGQIQTRPQPQTQGRDSLAGTSPKPTPEASIWEVPETPQGERTLG